jgi:hypothetical protein
MTAAASPVARLGTSNAAHSGLSLAAADVRMQRSTGGAAREPELFTALSIEAPAAAAAFFFLPLPLPFASLWSSSADVKYWCRAGSWYEPSFIVSNTNTLHGTHTCTQMNHICEPHKRGKQREEEGGDGEGQYRAGLMC